MTDIRLYGGASVVTKEKCVTGDWLAHSQPVPDDDWRLRPVLCRRGARRLPYGRLA